MAFPSQVRFAQTSAIVGDFIADGPRRGFSAILASTNAANNVVGRALKHVANSDTDVTTDAAGDFAGILVNSKNYALRGTAAGGTLAPTLVLPNNTDVEVAEMGKIAVLFTTTNNSIGNNVFYSDTDGSIGTADGTTLAGHTQIPNASVITQNVLTAGLGFIKITN